MGRRRIAGSRRRPRPRRAGRTVAAARSAHQGAGRPVGGAPCRHGPHLLPRPGLPRDCRHRRLPSGHREDAHVPCAPQAQDAADRDCGGLAMNVVPLDTDEHRAIQALLPWYLTRRLDSEDFARVEAHLAGCPSCREELELEQRLQAAQPLSREGDAERGLARMRELICATTPRERPVRAPALRWVFWGLVAQFAVIAVLAMLLVLPRTGADAHRTLGTPAAAVAAT